MSAHTPRVGRFVLGVDLVEGPDGRATPIRNLITQNIPVEIICMELRLCLHRLEADYASRDRT